MERLLMVETLVLVTFALAALAAGGAAMAGIVWAMRRRRVADPLDAFAGDWDFDGDEESLAAADHENDLDQRMRRAGG